MAKAARTSNDELLEAFQDFAPEYALVTDAGASPIIGTGGSSIVARTRYKGVLDRAVKILKPSEDLLRNQSGSQFLYSFRNEQALLGAVNHENVALLVDFGSFELGSLGVETPYVVTQYIAGPDLSEFANSQDLSWRDILRLIGQILRALDYLHQRRIMHCDVKPANIRIRYDNSTNDFNAVLLDLGVARTIPDGDPGDELTYFFSTRGYTLPELEPWVANKTGNRVPWATLITAFPFQDLFGLSKVLEELIRTTSSLPISMQMTLTDLATRLQSHQVASAGDALDVVERLAGQGLASPDYPELRTGTASAEKITAPWGEVGIDGRVEAFIDHPLFQRLRRTPQLDLLSIVMPGATNNRFLHSLHTLDLARLAVSHLASLPELAIEFSRPIADALLFRALLTNTGHYQLVHVFEDLIEDRRQEPAIEKLGLLSDDELFERTIGVNGAEPTPWSNVKDSRGRTLADLVVDQLGTEWLDLQRIFTKPETPLESTAAGLMASPIDLEKLAYLRDDAWFAGMTFGSLVDAEVIVGALFQPRTPEPPDGRGRLHLREGGLAYVEATVLARYWQIHSAYWHRTNRSLQAMVKHVVIALIVAGAFDFDDYLRQTLEAGQSAALHALAKTHDKIYRDEIRAKDRVNPLSDLLHNRRSIYKRVLTLSPASQTASRRGDESIYRHLSTKTAIGLYEETNAVRKSLSKFLGRELREGDVVIDVPRRKREEEGGVVTVWSDDCQELLGDLDQISPVVGSLRDSFDRYAKRMRVFVNPGVLASGDRSEIREHVLAHMREKYGPAR